LFAICRAAAAKPEHAVCLTLPEYPILGPLRSPSQPRVARQLLQAFGQKRIASSVERDPVGARLAREAFDFDRMQVFSTFSGESNA
jgi:hypothetical protein